MTPIESGSTVDQRVRTGIFLLMCLGMGGWFAYDGFHGYAAKNLEWASQNLPERPQNLKPNPRATKQNLLEVKAGDTPEGIKEKMGEPTVDAPRTLVFVGKEITVTVRINNQGLVQSSAISATKPGTDEKEVNIFVTGARAELVKEGMAESAVRQLFEKEPLVSARALWYIGPAAYGKYPIVDGKVSDKLQSDKLQVEENEHRSEWDIMLQRLIAACVGLAAIYAVFRFWQAMRARIVVDDSGLTYNGRLIAWDSMVRLKTDQYQDKAWVDLEYRDGGSERLLRLDALFVQRFKEIMAVICQRKGFTMPQRERESSETAEQ
jgi:hypothetical protein